MFSKINPRLWATLAIVAGVSVILVGASAALLYVIPEGRFVPEIVLTILLLAGVVALISVLVMGVAVLAVLGLTDRTRAFGMPEGTVRAVIALSLVVVFAMTSVFLYGQLRKGPESTVLEGLTTEQFTAIPVSELISSDRSVKDDGTVLYSAEIRGERQDVSDDFAKQLMTTLSTLVVAVAGFYFGTRAVAAARGVTVRSTPALHTITPANGKQGEEIDIVIEGSDLERTESAELVLSSDKLVIKDVLSSSTKIQGNLVLPTTQNPGIYELVVRTSDGCEAHLPRAFEVLAA